jgi:hypothetical protein
MVMETKLLFLSKLATYKGRYIEEEFITKSNFPSIRLTSETVLGLAEKVYLEKFLLVLPNHISFCYYRVALAKIDGKLITKSEVNQTLRTKWGVMTPHFPSEVKSRYSITGIEQPRLNSQF